MRRVTRPGLVSTFGFAAVVAVAELGARFIAPTLPIDPGKWPRVEIAQKLDQMRGYVNDRRDFDVVFVGSSMTAGGIDPLAFSRNGAAVGYNAAFAGPSMRTIAPWTLDIVEPMLEPEAVVLGIQSRELSDNGPKNVAMFEKFIRSPGYRQATSNIALRLASRLERISYFLRYRIAFRRPGDLFEADSPGALSNAKIRHGLGPFGRRIQTPRDYHSSASFAGSLYRNMLKDFAVGGPEYEALIEFHRELDHRGVKLIVVNMPVTEDYWNAHRRPAVDRALYHGVLRRFLEATGVTYIDAETALAEEAFRNPMHLDIDARVDIGRALAEAWPKLSEAGDREYYLVCNDGIGPCSIRPGPRQPSTDRRSRPGGRAAVLF